MTSFMAFSAAASVKSLAFVDTNASIACVSTSMPVSAVVAGGTERTSSASRIAASGSISSDTRGYFADFCGSLMTAKVVTSEPVPLVVGTATNDIFSVSPPFTDSQFMAFAASIDEPPPRANRTCGLKSRSCPIPFVTVAMSGSGFTSEKIWYWTPFFSMGSVRYPTIPLSCMNLSVTMNARLTPVRISSSPSFPR